jgi:peptidyl-prolyl cis-trans isomerase A (cyclophilin A)
MIAPFSTGVYSMRLTIIAVSVASLFSAQLCAQAATTKPAVTAPAAAPASAPTEVKVPVVKPQVQFTTTMGEFVLELEPERAPKTVENFLKYVNIGQYKDTIFHRVIPGFMVQGGGYTKELGYKTTFDPIENEGAITGLSNLRGTVAMARLDDPNSATSQFFINTVDNKFLNYSGTDSSRSWGYAVFGRVIRGMDVVDKIRAVKTDNLTPNFADKPLEAILITDAKVLPQTPAVEVKPAIAPKPAEPAAKN